MWRRCQDPRVTVVEGSITDRAAARARRGGAAGVFHLAALWLFECVHQPQVGGRRECRGHVQRVEACHRAGVRKIVYSSSASVYGDAAFTPMTEDHPFNNRTMYGATKIAGEQFLRAFYEQHRLDYVGLRYMNVYGPRMDYQGAYVSVIMKVLDRIGQNLAPVIFGDGSQAYDFVHVTDVARANVLAMTSDRADVFYNVGMGVKTTINELVARSARVDRFAAAARVSGRADVRHASCREHGQSRRRDRIRGARARCGKVSAR